MGRRTWIKIFADNWLRGTLREETPSIRGIWIDVLALAGDSTYGDEGLIQVADGVGLTDEQIAAVLCIKENEWLEAKQRLVDTKRLQVSKHNVIKILNWKKYQSEYLRQRGYRQRLQPKVTTESAPEKREERREKKEKRIEKKDINKERESRERNKHSLSPTDRDLILKNKDYYLKTYGITNEYIINFFDQCEAKGYKYANFAKALLVWHRKDRYKEKKPVSQVDRGGDPRLIAEILEGTTEESLKKRGLLK